MQVDKDSTMLHFQVDSLLEQQEEPGRPWLGFLRNDQLTTGWYVLDAESEDEQSLHDKDEIYYVMEGVVVREATLLVFFD